MNTASPGRCGDPQRRWSGFGVERRREEKSKGKRQRAKVERRRLEAENAPLGAMTAAGCRMTRHSSPLCSPPIRSFLLVSWPPIDFCISNAKALLTPCGTAALGCGLLQGDTAEGGCATRVTGGPRLCIPYAEVSKRSPVFRLPPSVFCLPLPTFAFCPLPFAFSSSSPRPPTTALPDFLTPCRPDL